MRSSILKKLLACVLLMTMMLTAAVGAFAEKAQLTSTQTFLNYLDEKDFKYTCHGLTDDGDERVTVSFACDNFDSLQVTLFFDPNEDAVSLRMWNIITVTADKNDSYATLQQLNAKYKYSTFVLDESDSTLQAEQDMFIDKDHCGKPVYDAMRYMVIVVDDNDVSAQIHTMA